MKETLMMLSNLDGISGREETVRAAILKLLQQLPVKTHIHVDALGNILCDVTGKARPNKKVMLSAHMDEVGCIITGFTEEGYLRFATVGGIHQSVLCGRRVRIGKQRGIIGCKAVHLCEKKEAEELPKTDQLLIDIGAASAKEAAACVSPGDAAVFDTTAADMQDMVMGKALDDRAGCTLLLELLKEEPPFDITLAFMVQEEVGLRGAGAAAFTVRPDIAVVVEATTAADIADVPPERQVCRVGGGPVVSFMDKSTVYDDALYRQIRTLADTLGIPHQTKTLIAGGNDAGAIQRTAGGIRVAAVSLPCRYLHSPVSVVSMQDMQHTKTLLLRLLEELPQ